MKDETGRLYKLLSERDFELRQLRKKKEDEKLLEGGSHDQICKYNFYYCNLIALFELWEGITDFSVLTV